MCCIVCVRDAVLGCLDVPREQIFLLPSSALVANPFKPVMYIYASITTILDEQYQWMGIRKKESGGGGVWVGIGAGEVWGR